MSSLTRWWLAIRPKTLSISVTPVVVGSCLGWAETGKLHWLAAAVALVSAMLIQIGTNLYNDAKDFERGADGGDRIGPRRAAAEGWFTPSQIKTGAHISFASAFLIGLYLVWVAGWPLLLLGVVSIATGYAYTGTNRPIAYSASGELFVFLFFGLAAVLGSHYVQTLRLSLDALIAAVSVGLLASAVLLVNNYRDMRTDQHAGKLTLAFRLGPAGSRVLYSGLLLAPLLLTPLVRGRHSATWLVLILLPLALKLISDFWRLSPGPVFNRVLAQTAALQLAFGLTLAVGLFI